MIKDRLILIVLLFVYVPFCSATQNPKKTVVVAEEGIYTYNDSLMLIVTIKNNYVYYSLKDHKGNSLITSIHRFSDLHKWAICLDTGSIWILSRDIGYAVWKYNSKKSEFEYVILPFDKEKKYVPKYIQEKLPGYFN